MTSRLRFTFYASRFTQMTKSERLIFSLATGFLYGWLILEDTGLVHYGSYGASLLHVAVIVASCAAAYAGLRSLEMYGRRHKK